MRASGHVSAADRDPADTSARLPDNRLGALQCRAAHRRRSRWQTTFITGAHTTFTGAHTTAAHTAMPSITRGEC